MADDLAGALRERVAIETWVAARDDAGSDAGYWRAERSVFAAVAPEAAAKAIEGEARRSTRRVAGDAARTGGGIADLAADLAEPDPVGAGRRR